MSAKKYNFSIEKGATFSQELYFTDSDGVAIDLTGTTFQSQMRIDANSSMIGTFTCELLDQVSDTGKMVMSMTSAETSALPTNPQSGPEKIKASYAYDLEQYMADGSVDRIIEGIVEVSPEVTR